jgi:hypothetical protein
MNRYISRDLLVHHNLHEQLLKKWDQSLNKDYHFCRISIGDQLRILEDMGAPRGIHSTHQGLFGCITPLSNVVYMYENTYSRDVPEWIKGRYGKYMNIAIESGFKNGLKYVKKAK